MSLIPNVPHYDVKVDLESYEEELLKVIGHARPEWKKEEIVLKKFGVNFVNLVIKCYPKDNEKDAIIARVNGTVVRIFQGHTDRKHEYKVIALLQELSIGVPVLLTFGNGFVMEYLHGRHFDWSERFYDYTEKDDGLIRLVVKELAKYHCERTAQTAKERNFDTTPFFRKHCQMLLDYVPREVGDSLFGAEKIQEMFGPHPHAVIEAEFNYAFSVLEALDLPVTFCHNDSNPTNFICKPEIDRAVLIDYEGCNFNYTAYDIANHIFLSCIGLRPSVDELYPSESFLRKWFRLYLEERERIGDDISPTETEINRWMKHFKHMMLAVCLWQTCLYFHWLQLRDLFPEDLLVKFTSLLLTRMARYWKEKKGLQSQGNVDAQFT